MCSICLSGDSKYRCPKCSVSTCSLSCVKKHKLDSKCDGMRSQAQYIPVKQFNELETLNDYRFLESITTCLDITKRSFEGECSQALIDHHQLFKECRNRSIFLRLPPSKYPWSQSRLPHFSTQENKMCWYVKWVFINAEVEINDERVPEDLTLGQALERLFEDQSNRYYSHLAYYISASFRGITPLIRVPNLKSSEKVYEQLDFSKTLTSNLRGKTIREFLTVYLILNEHKHLYLTDG